MWCAACRVFIQLTDFNTNADSYTIPGFDTGIFPGRGKCRCVQRGHMCVSAPARVL